MIFEAKYRAYDLVGTEEVFGEVGSRVVSAKGVFDYSLELDLWVSMLRRFFNVRWIP